MEYALICTTTTMQNTDEREFWNVIYRLTGLSNKYFDILRQIDFVEVTDEERKSLQEQRHILLKYSTSLHCSDTLTTTQIHTADILLKSIITNVETLINITNGGH